MDKTRALLGKFHASFHDSETILIARIKLFVGLLFSAVQTSGVDITSFITDSPRLQTGLKVFFAYLAVDGTVGEWARRHRATDLDTPDEHPSGPLDPGKP
jgi:hypothetical protein